MKFQNKKKILLIILCGLVAIQAVWFGVVQYSVDKSQVKTTATVVRIVNLGNTCNYVGPRSFCDSSDLLSPVYEYYDQNGTKYVKEDRYLGDFKANNPLRPIFGKDVGDKVTAYYTKDRPEEVSFMGGIFSYTAWFAPLYLTVTIVMGWVVVRLLTVLKTAINL